MEALSTQIRNLIRGEMEIRGLSIRDLAKLLECSKENVDQILRIGEREGKGMKTVIADRIFEALGLEVVVGVNNWGDWENCNHEWIPYGDFELGDVPGRPGKGSRQEVKCKKCGCPGEMYDDGTVEWPTT